MIRQRPDRDGLQVQVYAGRDPLTGRKRYVSRQVPGKGRAALAAAKQVEAELLAEVGAGRHKGSRSRTVGELLERWYEWRQTVKPISPTTVMSYRATRTATSCPHSGSSRSVSLTSRRWTPSTRACGRVGASTVGRCITTGIATPATKNGAGRPKLRASTPPTKAPSGSAP